MIVEFKSKDKGQKIMVNTTNIETIYALNDNCCKIEFVSGKTITVAICIGYEENCYIPDTFISDVSGTKIDPGYTQGARTPTTNAPADMMDISFAFSLNKYVAP